MRIKQPLVIALLGSAAAGSIQDIWNSALNILKLGDKNSVSPAGGGGGVGTDNSQSYASPDFNGDESLYTENESENLSQEQRLSKINHYISRMYGPTIIEPPSHSEPSTDGKMTPEQATEEMQETLDETKEAPENFQGAPVYDPAMEHTPSSPYDAEYEASETDSCDPQDPDSLIEPVGNDNNHISVNYINDSELESGYLYRRSEENETINSTIQQVHEQILAENEVSEYIFDPLAPMKKKERTKKQKEEATKIHAPVVVVEPKKHKSDKLSSDIRIVHGKSKKPINTNSKVAITKAEKKRNQLTLEKLRRKRSVPEDMAPFLLEDQEFVPGLKDLSTENKKQWKDYIFYDSKDEKIDWKSFEHHDTYEDECDNLDKIKKFVKEKLQTLKAEKRHAIAEIFNVLEHLKEGSHKGVEFLISVVEVLGKEAFLILKTLVVLVHRLNEAGLDGIKLVLSAVIDGEDFVLKQFEDDCVCNCDCPKLKGRLLNHLDLLFFFNPEPSTTWKSEEIVSHLKELFKITDKPGECWCDCFCDDKKNFLFNTYALTETELNYSPYLTSGLYGNSSISISVVGGKKKRRRGTMEAVA